MLYTFFNKDTNEKTKIDLPNCTITENGKAYVVKDSEITLFNINEEGEFVGNGEALKEIPLSGKHISIFNKVAKKDNYDSRLDSCDLENLSRQELKDNVKEVYTAKNQKVKKSKVSKHSLSVAVKNKTTKELDSLSYKEEKLGFWEKIKQKLKPKKKIKYKTSEFEYKVKNGETIESIAAKFDVSADDILKKNPQLLDSPIVEAGKSVVIPKAKHKVKISADNVQKIPEHKYIVDDADIKPATLANTLGISLYRLVEANPQLKMTGKNEGKIRKFEKGEELTIPEYEVVTRLNDSSLKGIAEQIGVSEAYIEDILFGIEGRHSEPDLEPYYDGVKDKTHPKGYLTIGFGHTGRVFGVVMTSDNKDEIQITKEEAYLILAQDLLIAKQDARQYFGDDFDKAPTSVQEGIIDIIFNKGVEGLEREDSPCLELKENLKNEDYTSAAANVIVDPTIRGLMKRNIYRVMMSTRDLSKSERKVALEKAQAYYEKTIDKFKNNKSITDSLSQHWSDAQNGKVIGFFK